MSFSSILSSLINQSIDGLKKLDPLNTENSKLSFSTTTTETATTTKTNGPSLSQLINEFFKKKLSASESSQLIPHKKMTARIISMPNEEKFALISSSSSSSRELEEEAAETVLTQFWKANEFLMLLCLFLSGLIALILTVRELCVNSYLLLN